MKSEKNLWTSISLLVGVVILILSLSRGVWQVWLLLGTFTLWGGWVIMFLLMPCINRAKRARLRRAQRQQSIQDVLEPMDAVYQQVEEKEAAHIAMLRHVNLRITEYLRSIYPDATWKWCEEDPVKLILHGGVGRIQVFGVEKYDHADIKIEKNGLILCSMLKIVPLAEASSSEEKDEPVPPNRQPVDPRLWYEKTGRSVLENVIADLNSRGHSRLTIQDGGKVVVEQDSDDIPLEKISGFPEKVYWPRLIKVLQGEGLSAQAQENGILVTW